MTHKEENIVNIAMRAAELLKDGRIERDEITGHAGLTEAIIEMADQFEKMNAGVDFDAEGRDYWLEIDAFAEEQLLERYGCEQKPERLSVLCEEYEGDDGIREFQILAISSDKDALRKLMEAKIVEDEYGMIEDNGIGDHSQDHFMTEFNCGFVEYYIRDEEVLSRDELERRAESVLGDEEADEPLRDGGECPVSVFAVSAGGVKREVYSGNLDECKQFCEDCNWVFKDENDFVWDLEMEDSRDELLPEDYFTALDYYSDKVGRDIENEFVRAHAEELVYCFHNEKEFNEFDYWTEYETLLGEKISYEEYVAVDDESPDYPSEIEPNDLEKIGALREVLTEFRSRDPHLFICVGDKQYAFLVKAVDREDAEKTGKEWYTKTFFEPGRFDCWNANKVDFEDLDTQDVIESKAYQKMEKEKNGLVGSLADNIKEAEGLKKEPENIEQEVCKVTFRRTLGVGLGEFDVYLNIVPEEYKGKKDGFLLSAAERCLAYEKAAEVVGDEDLSDFGIFTAEMVQAPKEHWKDVLGER